MSDPNASTKRFAAPSCARGEITDTCGREGISQIQSRTPASWDFHQPPPKQQLPPGRIHLPIRFKRLITPQMLMGVLPYKYWHLRHRRANTPFRLQGLRTLSGTRICMHILPSRRSDEILRSRTRKGRWAPRNRFGVEFFREFPGESPGSARGARDALSANAASQCWSLFSNMPSLQICYRRIRNRMRNPALAGEEDPSTPGGDSLRHAAVDRSMRYDLLRCGNVGEFAVGSPRWSNDRAGILLLDFDTGNIMFR